MVSVSVLLRTITLLRVAARITTVDQCIFTAGGMVHSLADLFVYLEQRLGFVGTRCLVRLRILCLLMDTRDHQTDTA